MAKRLRVEKDNLVALFCLQVDNLFQTAYQMGYDHKVSEYLNRFQVLATHGSFDYDLRLRNC